MNENDSANVEKIKKFIDLHQQVDMDYDDKMEMTAAAQASDD